MWMQTAQWKGQVIYQQSFSAKSCFQIKLPPAATILPAIFRGMERSIAPDLGSRAQPSTPIAVLALQSARKMTI
jgi:hypothetical protein